MSFDPGRLYTQRGIEFLEEFFISTNILLINVSELKEINHRKHRNNPRNDQTKE